jgi:hypothetical protein
MECLLAKLLIWNQTKPFVPGADGPNAGTAGITGGTNGKKVQKTVKIY